MCLHVKFLREGKLFKESAAIWLEEQSRSVKAGIFEIENIDKRLESQTISCRKGLLFSEKFVIRLFPNFNSLSDGVFRSLIGRDVSWLFEQFRFSRIFIPTGKELSWLLLQTKDFSDVSPDGSEVS